MLLCIQGVERLRGVLPEVIQELFVLSVPGMQPRGRPHGNLR